MTEVLQVVTRAPDVYRQAQGDDSGKGTPENWHAICVENSAGDTGRHGRVAPPAHACLSPLARSARRDGGAMAARLSRPLFFGCARFAPTAEAAAPAMQAAVPACAGQGTSPRPVKRNGFIRAGDAKPADREIPAARKAGWIAAPAPPPRSRRCAQATCCTPDRRQPGRRPT